MSKRPFISQDERKCRDVLNNLIRDHRHEAGYIVGYLNGEEPPVISQSRQTLYGDRAVCAMITLRGTRKEVLS